QPSGSASSSTASYESASPVPASRYCDWPPAGQTGAGLSQSLAQEVAGFGVKVTLIEPSGYSTDWAGPSARHAAELPAYEPVREQAAQARARRFTPGDPGATREAMLTLVDTPDPPLRLFLGEAPLGIATADYESRLAAWRAWQPVAAAAQGDGSGGTIIAHSPVGVGTSLPAEI